MSNPTRVRYMFGTGYGLRWKWLCYIVCRALTRLPKGFHPMEALAIEIVKLVRFLDQERYLPKCERVSCSLSNNPHLNCNRLLIRFPIQDVQDVKELGGTPLLSRIRWLDREYNFVNQGYV